MKILIKTFTDQDYLTIHKLFIDGKKDVTIGRCEPEDAIIGRDLIDASQIAQYMKLAYDAGIAGEKFDIEVQEIKDENLFWD